MRSSGSSAFEAALNNRQIGTRTKMHQKMRRDFRTQDKQKPKNLQTNALQIARSCFSFDATNATRITSTNSQSPTITIRATESWIETVQTEEDSLQAAEEDSSASDSIDSLTAKAMLHAAQLEASEKSDLMRNSHCRGEIGRLWSVATKPVLPIAQSIHFGRKRRLSYHEDGNNDVEEFAGRSGLE